MAAFLRRASVLALCWAACVSAGPIGASDDLDAGLHRLSKRLTKAEKAAIKTQADMIAQYATGIPNGTYTFRNVGTGSYISYIHQGQHIFPDPTATQGAPIDLEQAGDVSNLIRIAPQKVRAIRGRDLADWSRATTNASVPRCVDASRCGCAAHARHAAAVRFAQVAS